MAMNKKIKQEWLKALRSGEYKQGHGKLCTIEPDGSESLCCLGVLYDACIPGAVWRHDGNAWRIDSRSRDGRYILDRANRKVAGLSTQQCQDLAYMNDEEDKSLAEIADYIEKNL